MLAVFFYGVWHLILDCVSSGALNMTRISKHSLYFFAAAHGAGCREASHLPWGAQKCRPEETNACYGSRGQGVGGCFWCCLQGSVSLHHLHQFGL